MRLFHFRNIFMAFAVLVLVLIPQMTSAQEIDVTAKSAILIEATTGRVIWEKDGESRQYPASMTKMMTAILSIENISPTREVFISPHAALTEDTPLGIHAGDRLTAEELTQGMMMVSDNGAAVALAEEIDDSTSRFADRMNKKAADLGMDGTHFVNPNGLPDSRHYSTAHDMARLARYAMENPTFRRMVRQEHDTIFWSYPEGRFETITNTNKLLGQYKGTTGIKTGWTNSAGGCLAASAERNGVKLIAVLMHSETGQDRFSDMKKILDYGFQHVRMVRGISKEKISRRIFVSDGTTGSVMAYPVDDIEYPIIDGEDPSHYTISYDVPRVIRAPVSGNDIGKVIINYDGTPVGSIPLKSDGVEKGFSFGSLLVSLFGWLI